MKIKTALCVSLLLATALYYQPALAEKGGSGKYGGGREFAHSDHEHDYGHGHEHGKKSNKKSGKEKSEKRGRHSHDLPVAFIDDDKIIIKEYLAKEYYSKCPPGLAKKHNGCLPPGQAKKYFIGQPLHTKWHPVPQSLVGMLAPVPMGYQYVMVDKDVLLIAEASKKVIDAVTLLSAVGN